VGAVLTGPQHKSKIKPSVYDKERSSFVVKCAITSDALAKLMNACVGWAYKTVTLFERNHRSSNYYIGSWDVRSVYTSYLVMR
jgi:hypothetical protein